MWLWIAWIACGVGWLLAAAGWILAYGYRLKLQDVRAILDAWYDRPATVPARRRDDGDAEEGEGLMPSAPASTP